MHLNASDFRKKVLACWIGKNIGGTLGAPFEWRRQVNNVSFYTQDLSGEPLPNDDLDIQLLWLCALEERGLDLTAQTLADYWCLYVTPHWSEYGTAKTNMRSGLMPPLSGTTHNEFKDSCGAFIRSEIWACIAPAAPHIAARCAYEDAILDHGNGEGTFAAMFTAALESAAFVVSDIPTLIDIALSYIPADCGVAGAVRCAIESYNGKKTWREARDIMLEKFRGSAFFKADWAICAEDRAKGFFDGKFGWDVPSNIGMLIIGLLYGEDDFGKSVCTAVNCGEDTDCTGATVGALFGILHGSDAIPEKWITPIGRKIKTACLNLGELGYFGNQLPADCDALTDRTIRLTEQLLARHQLPIQLSDKPTALTDLKPADLKAHGRVDRLLANLNGPVYHFDFFDVAVDYGPDPFIRDNTPKAITLRIYNTYKTQATLHLRVYAPESWQVLPAREGTIFSLPAHLGPHRQVALRFLVPHLSGNIHRAAVELTTDGRPTVMLVPIVLHNGNLAVT